MPRLPCLLLLFTLLTAGSARAEPLELPFGQMFVQPIGSRGVEPSAALLAAQGREVRLVGFMVRQERPRAGRFLLAPRPLSMSEHADGEADDLPANAVTVILPPSQQDRVVTFQAGPLALTGRLALGASEDDGGRVSWLRLHLDPQALSPTAHLNTPPHKH